jgi:allophanate hydrolase subunit 2
MTRTIELGAVRGLALIEDAGRPGRLAMAVPRGGAMDLEGLACANLAVGNEPGAAAIERYGSIELVARTAVVVASEEGRLVSLVAGERATFAWDGARRVGYVAIEGGVIVPSFLGGLGTVLSLQRGGHEGRLLRRGDVLELGSPARAARFEPRAPDEGPIRVTPGPDLDRLAEEAIDALVGGAWSIDPRSDRAGTRLVGAVLRHRDGTRAITTPMIEGAIECPPGSPPIVLGPEHPTTGGYPVVAVVARADVARFHRVPLGRPVRFARLR